jgi:hypothetical protein
VWIWRYKGVFERGQREERRGRGREAQGEREPVLGLGVRLMSGWNG